MAVTEMRNAKPRGLLRSASLVSLMTFFSRILGFARDMIIAQMFGAVGGMDAFFIAFRIPNFMRRLFAEGAFSQAFVPVLAEYQKTRTLDEVRGFLSRIAGSMMTVLFFVTIVGVLGAPLIVFLFAPGFGYATPTSIIATEMLRITFPYLLLVSLAAMSGAILNTYGYFAVPALTPVLLNLSMIVAAWFFSAHFAIPPMALAWGVCIAGVLQLLFQIPFLHQRKLLVRPRIGFKDPGVRRVLKLMVPALFGVSIAQINIMIDTIFASFLPVGSVTWLFYTDRLTDFPLGVFGVAIATVILPHLSRRHAEQNSAHFSQSLDWGLRLLLFIGVPASLGLAIFSMPLIASCFAHGKFSIADTLQTQKSLITLSLGVPAFMMVKILASGFYAQQNINTPVKVGALAMVVNTVLCVLFVRNFAHAGLTLASTIAGYVNCGVLLYLLIHRKIYTPVSGWLRYGLQLSMATVAMSIYLWFFKHDIMFWIMQPMVYRFLVLLFHVCVASGIYFIVLWCCGMRITEFRARVKD